MCERFLSYAERRALETAMTIAAAVVLLLDEPIARRRH
jgi:ABC-type branched-subunit amino acid transport system ATPase component